MNSQLDNFIELLFKYKFRNPISISLQNRIIKSRKENLLYILKKTGYYSSIFGLVLAVFYWARSIGINVTIIKSKIIAGIIILNITISTVAGVHYIKKYIIDTPEKGVIASLEESEKNTTSSLGQIDKNKETITNKLNYNIGVQDFSGDPGSAAVISAKIIANLGKIMGPDKVTSIKNVNRNRVTRVLMGSVRDIGERKFITARIVNIKNTKVELVVSEEVKSINDLDDACLRLSRQIAAKFE